MSTPCLDLGLTDEISPIVTNGGRGVAVPGIVKAHHAVIFTTREVPQLLPDEGPTRNGTEVDALRRAIRVIPAEPTSKLDEHSRLNFGRIYLIAQASCEIYVFGTVAPDSMIPLLYQFIVVQASIRRILPTAPGNEPRVRAPQHPHGNQRSDAAQHQRFDSVQQRSAGNDHDKSPSSSDESDGDDNDDNEDDDDDDENDDDDPSQVVNTLSSSSTDTAALAHQLGDLQFRAQHYGIDLSSLMTEQRQAIARLPPDQQMQHLSPMLQIQNSQS